MIKDQDIAIEKYREFRESFPKTHNPFFIVHKVKTWNYGLQEKNETIEISLKDILIMLESVMGIKGD